MIEKIVEKFKKLTPNVQGFIILIFLLIIGIIIRWDYVIDNIIRGFKFFSK
jgi:hypothetical protein